MKFAILAKRTEPIRKDGKNVDINTEKLNSSNNNNGEKNLKKLLFNYGLFSVLILLCDQNSGILNRENQAGKNRKRCIHRNK